MLILVRYVPARFHDNGLEGRGRRTGRFCRELIAMRIFFARNFHFAVDLSALFNSDPDGYDISADFAGAANFDAFAAPDCALHFSAHDDFAGIHIGGDLAMRPYRHAAVGKVDRALDFAVNV
jgi:hypothetical protein